MKPLQGRFWTRLALTAALGTLTIGLCGAGEPAGQSVGVPASAATTAPHDAAWWLGQVQLNLDAVKDAKDCDYVIQMVVAVLSEAGDWSKARTYVARLSDKRKLSAYITMANTAAKRGDAKTAESIVNDAPEGPAREAVRRNMALGSAAAGDLDSARRIMARLAATWAKDSVLAAIARAQATAGADAQGVQATLDAITSEEARKAAAVEVKAIGENRKKQVQARSAASFSPLEAQLCFPLFFVGAGTWGPRLEEAIELGKAGRMTEAIKLLDQVEGAILKMDPGLERTTAMVRLALVRWLTGQRDSAKALLHQVRGDMANTQALTQPTFDLTFGVARPALVTAMVMVGETKEAITLAEAAANEKIPSRSELSAVAVAMAACGQWSELATWLSSLKTPEQRAYVCLGAFEWQAYAERKSTATTQPR